MCIQLALTIFEIFVKMLMFIFEEERFMSEKNNTKEFFRALKFTLISISAGLIQIGTFTLFNEVFKWNYWLGYLTSLLLSILWN